MARICGFFWSGCVARVKFGADGPVTLLPKTAGLPMVLADSEKLLQVLINLVYNAIKFADAGVVACSAVQVRSDIAFAVADEGPGIDIEHQNAIFNKIWQHGDLLTDRPKGTGLGLAICKEIITQHHGRVRVESELGQGSVFKFTIPIARQDQV